MLILEMRVLLKAYRVRKQRGGDEERARKCEFPTKIIWDDAWGREGCDG